MSLIHEALEKVGQEKPILPLPSGGISETKEKVRSKENLRVIYGIVIALVFCFILGMIYLFVGPAPREESVERPVPILLGPNQGRFVLTGITRVGAEGTAIINNELVRVGDGVSGARVVRIDEEEVILDEGGETVTLELYGQGTNPLTRLEKTK